MSTPKLIAQKLTAAKQTLSVAESCTGGLISSTLTDIPGSSVFFHGSVIAYDNAVKTSLVRVPAALIKKHGAVSAPVAKAMAQNIRKTIKTDYGIGVTGIAGPTGGTKAKPVGLIFIAASSSRKTIVKRFIFKGTRLTIKRQAAKTALTLLLELIEEKKKR